MPDDTPQEREPIRKARQLTRKELALLNEAREFVRTKGRELQAMLPASVKLRGRLARTRAFKLVDGHDAAQETPIWDMHATLDICFERSVKEMVHVLRDAVERPGAHDWRAE